MDIAAALRTALVGQGGPPAPLQTPNRIAVPPAQGPMIHRLGPISVSSSSRGSSWGLTPCLGPPGHPASKRRPLSSPALQRMGLIQKPPAYNGGPAWAAGPSSRRVPSGWSTWGHLNHVGNLACRLWLRG